MIEKKLKTQNSNNIIKDKFLPMFNQNDTELMTPLDIIINRNDEKSLKFVMNTIHDLCKKYSIGNNNIFEKSFSYKIMKFKINTTKFQLGNNYIQTISSQSYQCKKFIQKYNVYKYNNNSKDKENKNQKISCTFEEVYSQSKYYINDEYINNSKIIIDLILNDKIEDEFKIINPKYKHEFLDTEEKLAK